MSYPAKGGDPVVGQDRGLPSFTFPLFPSSPLPLFPSTYI